MGQSVRSSDTFLSKGGNYELGFFTRKRENSTKYYVGIWSKKVPHDKIVWVLVTGNLVLVSNSNQEILWQSFNYPTDTLLPGMNIGHDNDTGYTWSLRSWTSVDDPSPGPYTLQYNSGFASLTVNKGSNVLWVDGNSNLSIQVVFNRVDLEQNYATSDYFTLPIHSNSRLILDVSGDLKYQGWSKESKLWSSLQSSKCRTNNSCGKFSICNPQDRDPCQCLDGFTPFDADSWKQGNRSAGCVRFKELSCSNNNSSKDGFSRFSSVELPPNDASLLLDSVAQCNNICFTNCSCVAFAYDFNGNCMLWNDQVPTLKNISSDSQDGDKNKLNFYLRLGASDVLTTIGGHANRKRNLLVIVILISFLILLILLGLFVYWTRKQRRKGVDLLNFEVGMTMKVKDTESDFTRADKGAKIKRKEVKLPLFSFVSVSAATNNFSDANKLGEGGFGPVYKGTLLNGGEVAVKRLSQRSDYSAAALSEMKKMLIYEFMPNKSLDCFLFDAEKRGMLDWGTRVRIIEGIAQGILYLHQHSRFRIIHRDLKASNILLDTNMNPKISDFGMARIFGENVLQANTNRIVGTYGYMSLEYAMEGIFSIKSDVFSFGVLLLEIISGKKNTGFYQTNSFDLLGYAWDLWTNDSGIDLINRMISPASI
ncbi:G-type lectin S-receptor serine/threonine-protein kinase [Trifolium repens]|nr:G-type lectin S-receptor serine/threonine-protein kinase [Trifolium repens]